MLRAVIIEDEQNSADALSIMLKQYCPDILLDGVFSSVEHGFEGINKLKPDLIFLDIMLTDSTGFDLLLKFPSPDFKVIFTTAFDKYALRAIRISALDYLLKPIDIAELKQAVAKASQQAGVSGHKERLELLNRQLSTSSPPKQIALPSINGFSLVNVDDMIRLEADGAYCRIFIDRQPSVYVSHNLKHFETILEGTDFVRVHHSHLINMRYVKNYINGNGGFLELHTGGNIPVAKRRKQEFMEYLKRNGRT